MTYLILLAAIALALHLWKTTPSLGVLAASFGASSAVASMGSRTGGIFQALAANQTWAATVSLIVTGLCLPWWAIYLAGLGLGAATINNASMLGCFAVVGLSFAPLKAPLRAGATAGLLVPLVLGRASQPLGLYAIMTAYFYPRLTALAAVALGIAVAYAPSLVPVQGTEGWLSSTGRWDMWMTVIQKWPGTETVQGFFLGSGPGTGRLFLPGLSPDRMSPWTSMHSDWLELFFTWGSVAFFSAAYFAITTWEKARGADRLAVVLVVLGMAANYPWHEPGFALLMTALVTKIWRSTKSNVSF
jgi:hypothetical protein